mmetsp:Transcript_44831/g.80655  ORF Transcript_44831/g.80655 Transcript_44831/m.80655 type:complete len:200 (-) Transcript_44831:1012-1611(-)
MLSSGSLSGPCMVGRCREGRQRGCREGLELPRLGQLHAPGASGLCHQLAVQRASIERPGTRIAWTSTLRWRPCSGLLRSPSRSGVAGLRYASGMPFLWRGWLISGPQQSGAQQLCEHGGGSLKNAVMSYGSAAADTRRGLQNGRRRGSAWRLRGAASPATSSWPTRRSTATHWARSTCIRSFLWLDWLCRLRGGAVVQT